MVDKSRSARRRKAGKSGKDSAGPRKIGGVDRRALEALERRGLLSAQGRRLLEREREGNRPVHPVRKPAAKPVHTSPGRAEDLVAERLQKVMARAGVASRRHSEELIQAGRVKVNGEVVTQLGTKVVPGRDIIEVDGRPLGKPQELVYILMNKPKGYVTTLYDPQGRPKVTDLLGGEVAERVYPVGRLDFDTEGLLLLTNDGQLAHALMHPSKQIKKTYIAKVRGVPGPGKLKALERGIELEDGPTAPAEVRVIDVKPPNSATISIRIHEGRNRQVRRMFAALGHEVIHLRRTTLGPLHLKDLKPGEWRELTPQELFELRRAAGMKAPRGELVAALQEQNRTRRRDAAATPAKARRRKSRSAR